MAVSAVKMFTYYVEHFIPIPQEELDSFLAEGLNPDVEVDWFNFLQDQIVQDVGTVDVVDFQIHNCAS